MTAHVNPRMRVINPTRFPFTLNAARGTFGLTGQAGTLTGPSAPSSFNPNYPRLFSGRLGPEHYSNPQPYYGTAYRDWAKYMCIQTLGGNYAGGYDSMFKQDRNTFVQTLKSESLTSGKVLQYIDPSYFDSGTATSWPGWNAHITANNWGLYVTGTSGTIVGLGSPTQYMPNQSLYTPADSNGDKCSKWAAKFWQGFLRTKSGNTYSPSDPNDGAPLLDGFYKDDVWYTPVQQADVNRDGVTDTGIQNCAVNDGSALAVIAESWRAGNKEFYLQQDADNPTAFRFANNNIINHLLGQSVFSSTLGTVPANSLAGSYDQLFDAFEAQYILGWGNIEGYHSAAELMNAYIFACNICRGPKIVCLDVANLQSDGSGPQTFSGADPATYTEAYRYMRFITAFTLMNSGAIGHDGFDSATDNNLLKFDEWGNNASQYPSGYLGQPIDAPQTAAWSNGVMRRRFQNGSQVFHVYYNQRGNGTPSVSFGRTLYRLRGVQNTTLNNASAQTGHAFLNAPDGIILGESPQ